MSNTINNKRIKPFGILIASLAVVLAIIATITVSVAWFTGADSKTKDSTTPYVLVALDTDVANSGQVVDLTTSTTVSVIADSNVDVYIRAKVVVLFYDSSNNLITGLNVADYYTITYQSGWSTPNGYQAGFKYYNLASAIATGSTSNAITTDFITNVGRTATALPENVAAVKLQMFAESVQGNAAGLAKWAA